MYRNLTKFIIALLVILSDCVYAAECRSDNPKRNTADIDSQLQSQIELSKNTDLDSPANDALPGKELKTALSLYFITNITQASLHLQASNYTSFSPRAPPTITHI